MIQDIAPHKLYNQYAQRTDPTLDDYVFSFEGAKLLMCLTGKDEQPLSFPKVKDFGLEYSYTYLFSVDDEHFFMLSEPKIIPDSMAYIDVHFLRRKGSMELRYCYAAMTGKHLADWYRDTRFCGRCGKPMQHSDRERAMVCPICKFTAYPRIMPAVIVGVINGDKLLLTKYRTGFSHNALIAGFTEIGETLEDTVAREVMEEAGIKVKNIRYYKSQPWGIANDILVGYYCEVDGDDEIHMDDQELKFAQWVSRDEIVLQPDNFSLTNEMMTMFQQRKQ